jgi:hypothetical protein
VRFSDHEDHEHHRVGKHLTISKARPVFGDHDKKVAEKLLATLLGASVVTEEVIGLDSVCDSPCP